MMAISSTVTIDGGLRFIAEMPVGTKLGPVGDFYCPSNALEYKILEAGEKVQKLLER